MNSGWCGNSTAHCGLGCVSECTLSSAVTANAEPRSDGRCGASFGGATCDPSGAYGGCCSQYGYCGTTPQHCLVENGCQSGCTDAMLASGTGSTAPPTTANTASSGSSAAASSATNSEPVISAATSSVPASEQTGAVTTDGTCGSANGNTVCGDWYLGQCCSMYGVSQRIICGHTKLVTYLNSIAVIRRPTAERDVRADRAIRLQLSLLRGRLQRLPMRIWALSG